MVRTVLCSKRVISKADRIIEITSDGGGWRKEHELENTGQRRILCLIDLGKSRGSASFHVGPGSTNSDVKQTRQVP